MGKKSKSSRASAHIHGVPVGYFIQGCDYLYKSAAGSGWVIDPSYVKDVYNGKVAWPDVDMETIMTTDKLNTPLNKIFNMHKIEEELKTMDTYAPIRNLFIMYVLSTWDYTNKGMLLRKASKLMDVRKLEAPEQFTKQFRQELKPFDKMVCATVIKLLDEWEQNKSEPHRDVIIACMETIMGPRLTYFKEKKSVTLSNIKNVYTYNYDKKHDKDFKIECVMSYMAGKLLNLSLDQTCTVFSRYIIEIYDGYIKSFEKRETIDQKYPIFLKHASSEERKIAHKWAADHKDQYVQKCKEMEKDSHIFSLVAMLMNAYGYSLQGVTEPVPFRALNKDGVCDCILRALCLAYGPIKAEEMLNNNAYGLIDAVYRLADGLSRILDAEKEFTEIILMPEENSASEEEIKNYEQQINEQQDIIEKQETKLEQQQKQLDGKTAEFKKLKEKIATLETELNAARTKKNDQSALAKEFHDKLKNAEKEAADAKQEAENLQILLNELLEAENEDENVENETDDIDIKEITELLQTENIVMIGGRPNTIAKLKETFPNWKHFDGDHIPTTYESTVCSATAVCLFTEYMSHGLLERCMPQIRKCNIPHIFVRNNNIDNVVAGIWNKVNE